MAKYLYNVLAIAAAGSLLAACAGVPKSLTPDLKEGRSGPTIREIVNHVRCEVRGSDARLNDKNYLVTVLLTLQVNDSVDLTPSIALTSPQQTKLVTSLGGDLGGARQRTFTTTFTMNAHQLFAQDAKAVCASTGAAHTGPYDLRGDLRISEIVQDGFEAITSGSEIVQASTGPTDKSAPTFGSQVQFVITRSGNIGPTWTLKSFKGAAGSNGLVNGKRLDTDSILITFAPKAPPAAQLELIAQRYDPQIAAAQADLAAAQTQAFAARGNFESLTTRGTPLNAPGLVTARQALEAADASAAQKQGELQRLTRARQAAVDSLDFDAESNASQASKELLNTMLLQNLQSLVPGH